MKGLNLHSTLNSYLHDGESNRLQQPSIFILRNLISAISSIWKIDIIRTFYVPCKLESLTRVCFIDTVTTHHVCRKLLEAHPTSGKPLLTFQAGRDFSKMKHNRRIEQPPLALQKCLQSVHLCNFYVWKQFCVFFFFLCIWKCSPKIRKWKCDTLIDV